jgi:hypothetical protein
LRGAADFHGKLGNLLKSQTFSISFKIVDAGEPLTDSATILSEDGRTIALDSVIAGYCFVLKLPDLLATVKWRSASAENSDS